MGNLTNEKVDKSLNDLIYTIKDGVFAIAIGILLAIISCNVTKKTQAQKDAEARVKQIALLTEVRKQLPCDTITTFYTVGSHQYTTFDTSKSGVITITRYKTFDRVVTKVVLDSALAHQRLLESMQKDYYLELCEEQKDSLANETLKLIQDNQQLKRYKTSWMWLRGVGIGLLTLGAIWGFRKQIISLIKRLFI